MGEAYFIPKKLHVGLQERDDTYTGKLAYIIYTDDKKVKRKERSWESWRDESIKPLDISNEPTEGFVINKKAGGTTYNWNTRKTTARIYDPRGFEIEIGIENLLFILENTSSFKGKGLEGEFVYSWDGTELMLLPVDCEGYSISKKYSDILFDNKQIKAVDLVEGYTYFTKAKEFIYLGKYPNYDKIKSGKPKKEFFFGVKYEYSWRKPEVCLVIFSSISKKFTSVEEEESIDYPEHMERLKRHPAFSPRSVEKSKFSLITREEMCIVLKGHGYSRCLYHVDNNFTSKSMYISTDEKVESALRKKVQKVQVYLENGECIGNIGVNHSREDKIYSLPTDK